MSYVICASTEKTSIEVIREDPADALAKIAEFEAMGLKEVAVLSDGRVMTREELRALETADGPVSGAAAALH